MTTYTVPLGSFDSFTSDGALGSQVNTDRDRPPAGTFVFGPSYDGTCFVINGNLLYYCKPKQPESWPADFFIEVGTKSRPGVCGVFHNGQPFYLNKQEMWYIQGTGSGVFQPIPTDAKAGAQSVYGAISVAGKGIYHTGTDGVYLFANWQDTKITEDAFEPIFRGETVGGIPGVGDMSTSWLHVSENIVYFGYAGSSDTYPKNVLVFNLQTDRVAYYEYGLELSSVTNDVTNSRILAGGGDGFIRVLEDTTSTDDAGTAISWETQSKDYTMQTRRHFPRWVKYDVDGTATGSLLLDDTVHQTHSITGSRNTKRRLVKTGNGNRASLRIAGSGTATLYSAEFE